MLDLPPAIVHEEVSPRCVLMAAQSFNVPPLILGALMVREGGRNGMKNKNKNGSYDYGVMQINSAWLSRTQKVGFNESALRYDGCKSVWVASWILRRCLDTFNQSFWHGVGCYHSGENPKKPEQKARQVNYAQLVFKAAQRIDKHFHQWLNTGKTVK